LEKTLNSPGLPGLKTPAGFFDEEPCRHFCDEKKYRYEKYTSIKRSPRSKACNETMGLSQS
jgi:hypothetical protein